MRKRLDIAGFRFGRITAVKVSQKATNQGKILWDLVCECGNNHTGLASDLTRGKILSCGCWRKEVTTKRNTTHGKTRNRSYNTWNHIKDRCLNPKNNAYYNYGERGIDVCQEWISSFDRFYLDMGDQPKGMSIERIDNNKGYCKSNCKWATSKEQNRNKRNIRFVSLFGQKEKLSYWCDVYDIQKDVLWSRIKNGWTDYEAVTRPVRKKTKTQTG